MHTERISETVAVTTPVYVGHSPDVATAATCEHPGWIDTKSSPGPAGTTMTIQRCRECIAVRCRIEAPTAAALDLALAPASVRP